jgi:hypothetical protein
MKFKTLRTKKEPKEFVHIDTIATTMILYTGDLPKPQPLTATMEGLKEYYKNDIPLPDQLTLDDIEMVEFEMFEADTVGVDIRNKLSPPENLVRMLEEFFTEPFEPRSNLDRMKQNDLIRLIKKEMKETKINMKYIADLL